MVDTKDWTWVLQRPCPACRFDARSLRREQIGATTRAVGALFAEVLVQPNAVERPAPEVWSPLEYGCHLVDVFDVMQHRLHMMRTDDGPTFPNWDQDATAIERAYHLQDPGPVAQQVASEANRMADAFDAVTDPEWNRPGLRSNGSRFTVETLGRYMVHDLVHHVWDVGGALDG